MIRTGLTYDDVLLVPKRTLLNSRKEADIKTKFTKNIRLNTPLISSNMVSVTEHKMAIAMALEGGLGVIHQFNTPKEQAKEIKKVKKSTSYIVDSPLSVSKDITLKEAINVMDSEGITSLLIKNGNGLEGILTLRDYSMEKDLTKKVSTLMTSKSNLITAEYGISLEDAKEILHKYKIEKLPLLHKGELKGLITRRDIKRRTQWPNASRDKKGRLMVGGAVGVKDSLERAEALIAVGVDVIVLDIAHGHSNFVIKKLKELKKLNIDIMVGNIATKTAAKDLIKAGADGLKIGIGPSPVCTTRLMSGAGIPQLTAIMEVYSVAKKYNIPVCADGGAKYPGDVSKAIAAGASTVFSGSFFAGTSESPGLIITIEGKRYKRYMGSASYDSNHERKEKLEKRKHKEKLNIFVEGVSTLVDYKGPVKGIISSLVKGLKSGISYCGAKNLEEMKKNAEFIKTTTSGIIESKARGKRLSD